MFAISKILFPVDFSERSIAAGRYAKALACVFHSELHLLNVVDLRVYGMYGMGNDEDAATRFGIGCKKEAQENMGGFLEDELRNLNVKRCCYTETQPEKL
jgi:nucleotide-binding universal stress UspA family protein